MPLWDIFEEMERMRRRYEKLFKEWQVRPLMIEGIREPLTDVRETEKSIIIDMELPGVKKKDIEINIMEDEIEVKSEAKISKEVKKEGFYKRERAYQGFYKRFSLPAKVIPNKAKAEFKDGILTIKIPKVAAKEEKKKKVKVEIK